MKSIVIILGLLLSFTAAADSVLTCKMSRYDRATDKILNCEDVTLNSGDPCVVGKGACSGLALLMFYVQKDDAGPKSWTVVAGPGDYTGHGKGCDMTKAVAFVDFPEGMPSKFGFHAYLPEGIANWHCDFKE